MLKSAGNNDSEVLSHTASGVYTDGIKMRACPRQLTWDGAAGQRWDMNRLRRSRPALVQPQQVEDVVLLTYLSELEKHPIGTKTAVVGHESLGRWTGWSSICDQNLRGIRMSHG